MINSSIFSAQNRKRCYWTNIRIDYIPCDKGIVLSDILEKNVPNRYFISEKLVNYFSSEINRNGFVRRDKFRPIYNTDSKGYSITTRSGQRATDNFIIQRPRGYNKGGFKAINGKTPTLTSTSWQENNHSLTTNKGEGYKIFSNKMIRKLTPLECERLQTLPDNYTAGVSDTQRYKAIGNGWTVDVIAHIISFLKLQYKNEVA